LRSSMTRLPMQWETFRYRFHGTRGNGILRNSQMERANLADGNVYHWDG